MVPETPQNKLLPKLPWVIGITIALLLLLIVGTFIIQYRYSPEYIIEPRPILIDQDNNESLLPPANWPEEITIPNDAIETDMLGRADYQGYISQMSVTFMTTLSSESVISFYGNKIQEEGGVIESVSKMEETDVLLARTAKNQRFILFSTQSTEGAIVAIDVEPTPVNN